MSDRELQLSDFVNLSPVLSEGLDQSVDDGSLQLAQLIPKIIAQKGSFLNITEESLIEEIEKGVAEFEAGAGAGAGSGSDADELMEDVDESAEVSANNEPSGNKTDTLITQEEFMKEKEKIISLVHSALNESSLSLDFVSLLISCVRPAAGSSSMSPQLKQHIKIGSLSSDRVQPSSDNKQVQFEVSKVGRGWKLESLERASENLKNASSRLKEEVLMEKNYWNDMMEVLKSKEVISTINTRSSREICVKYGFGDAGSNYYDKGIGLLKKGPAEGRLVFEKLTPQQSERTDKVVSVKIFGKNSSDATVLLGESNSTIKIKQFSDEGVTSEIAKARFYLFEEELFYHLLKEAATLISLQVAIEANKIVVDLHDEIIEIESVPIDEVTEHAQDLELNSKADMIGNFLRLMLCAEHKQNLDKKKIPPIALSQDQQLRSQQLGRVSLIRPLITYNKHERTLKQLEDVLTSVLTAHLQIDSATAAEIMKNNYKLTKYYNDPNTQSKSRNVVLPNKNPFIRCTTYPSSKLELAYSNLKTVITLRSLSDSAYSMINLRLFNRRNDTRYENELLNVNFNDISELEDCLGWAIRQYTEEEPKTSEAS